MPLLLPTGPGNNSAYRTWMPSDPTSPTLSNEQFNAIATRVYGRSEQRDTHMSAIESIGRWAVGAGIDLADTFASSPVNPVNPMGLVMQRGDLWNHVPQAEQDYYKRHQALIEGSSAVAGGILVGVAAEAVAIPRLTTMLSSSTALTGTRIWKAAEAWNVASRANMLGAQRLAAEAGEAYGLLGSKSGWSFLANRVVAGTAMTTRTLPFEYGAMWNNDSFNSGDWEKEGFWIGAGAVFGGTLGVIGARSATRKFANSLEIRDTRAAPLALAGVSNDLLATSHLDLARRLNPDAAALKESAFTTEFFIAARSANPTGVSAVNATRLSKMRDEYGNLAAESTQKIISKGIAGVETLRIKIKDIPEVKHLVQVVGKDDPYVFHGLSEMGFVKGTIEDAKAGRLSYIEGLGKQAEVQIGKGNVKEEERLLRLKQKLQNQDEYLMINGSWVDPNSPLGKVTVAHDPEYADRFIIPSKDTEGFIIKLPNGNMTIDASLAPRDGRGIAVNIEHMPLRDKLILDQAAGKTIDKMLHPKAKVQFRLTTSSAGSWYGLDMAAEILDRGGHIEFDKAALGTKLATKEDIKRESLRLKARLALNQAGKTGRITQEMRFKYNLPAPTPMELIEDPAGDGFKQWLIGAAKDDGNLNELANALTDYRSIKGIDLLPSSGAEPIRVDGNMLKFNRNEEGVWLKPILAYFDRRNNIESITRRGQSSAATLHKAEKTAILLSGNNHVGQLARDLTAMPELIQAMDIAGLHSNQITGGGGGFGQVLGEILPTRFRYRDNATLLAATKVQETAERHGLSTFEGMMTDVGMQEDVTRLGSTGHAHEKAMIDQYFSLRGGWDIEGTAAMGDGMFGFRLKDTKANRSRLNISLQDKWTSPLLQNDRLGQPIVVNQSVLSTIDKYNKGVSDLIMAGDNTLRASRGQSLVERKNFYTPPPNTRGALVAFVFDAENKVVPGRTITARSQEEFENLYNRTLNELGRNSGYTIRTRDQLSSLRDVWDEAAMDWIDPGLSSATAGIGTQKGGLTGAYVRQDAFKEALDWAKRKVVAQSQDTLRNIMNEHLVVARAQGAAEGGLVPGKVRTVFDEYEKALTGQSQKYTDTAKFDKILRRGEEVVNGILAKSSVMTPANWLIDWAQRVGMNPVNLVRGKTGAGAKTYREISEAMGPYTPFSSVTEYIESRGIRRPPTVKGMATTMNSLAAGVMLRWLELPHSVVNMLGLLSTMPAAVLGQQAPISTFVRAGGQDIGFLDGGKIIANAMKDMFQKGASQDWAHMRRMGDAKQSVIDYHQALGAVNSQAGFMRWAKSADKWAATLTDTSENWSRQLAHFVGLRMADYHGITGMAGRHDFAREIANSMIADYAPVNRPELFASGFGSMIGLFQSYALNHYTRMFRWMENGEYAKAGLQAAMQASMFGLPGTYGFGSLLDIRDSVLTSGGDPTALDLIYEHYGPVLGGAIAHGSVSQLTHLALWSRGDMSVRIPGASGPLPAIDVGTKVARGFVDAVGAYMNAMPGEGRRAVMEAVQRDMPSRVMRSWLTLLNGGQEVDSYGQVMSETTTWMDTIARTVGVRSTRQQAELESYYAGKGAMERDAVQMDKLRQSFRTAIRAHSGDMTAVNPVQYFNGYVKAGGNPVQFKTWVRNLLRDSDSSRSVKQLKAQLTTPRAALETWRYGAYGAWDIGD